MGQGSRCTGRARTHVRGYAACPELWARLRRVWANDGGRSAALLSQCCRWDAGADGHRRIMAKPGDLSAVPARVHAVPERQLPL